MLKKIYRFFLDTIEELTTGLANRILVNSKFTSQIFSDSFRLLSIQPDILYPCIKEDAFNTFSSQSKKSIDDLYKLLDLDSSAPMPRIITSLNRYERK